MLYGYTQLNIHIQHESKVKLSGGAKGITKRGKKWEAGREEGKCLRDYTWMKTSNVNLKKIK